MKPDVAVASAQALVRAQQLALEALLPKLRDPGRTEVRWALEALSPPVAVSARTLAGYVGGYGERKVAVEGGKLAIRQGRRPPRLLTPLAPDLFAMDGVPSPTRVKFERDAAGRVTGLLQMAPDGRMSRFARD